MSELLPGGLDAEVVSHDGAGGSPSRFFNTTPAGPDGPYNVVSTWDCPEFSWVDGCEFQAAVATGVWTV